MERRLILHVGTPKSGTTHLQSVLAAARGHLARAGLLYPGLKTLPQNGLNHQPAVYALAGPSLRWVDDEVRSVGRGYLHRIGEEVSTHRGPVLISAESLAFFEASDLRLLVDRLGYRPDQVSVVITARDLGRVLPSIWQQNVKNGSTQPLTPYLESVAGLRDRPGAAIWSAFRLPWLVDRLVQVVDVDRITLVTAPQVRGHGDDLWHRFADSVGAPLALLHAAGHRARAQDNASLSMSQVETLRHLNLVMESEGYARGRQRSLRVRLLDVWMNLAQVRGPRPAVPDHLRPAVQAWGEEDVVDLQRRQIRVIGSLEDLRPRFPADGLSVGEIPINAEVARDVLSLIEVDATEQSWPRGHGSLVAAARRLIGRRDVRAFRRERGTAR